MTLLGSVPPGPSPTGSGWGGSATGGFSSETTSTRGIAPGFGSTTSGSTGIATPTGGFSSAGSTDSTVPVVPAFHPFILHLLQVGVPSPPRNALLVSCH